MASSGLSGVGSAALGAMAGLAAAASEVVSGLGAAVWNFAAGQAAVMYNVPGAGATFNPYPASAAISQALTVPAPSSVVAGRSYAVSSMVLPLLLPEGGELAELEAFKAAEGVATGIRVTEKGMQLLEENLARVDPAPYNDAMVARLRAAMGAGERVTGGDANFYLHEISEGTFRARGLGYDAAHAAALEKYGASPFSIYPPEIISAYPGWFNNAWRAYWGM